MTREIPLVKHLEKFQAYIDMLREGLEKGQDVNVKKKHIDALEEIIRNIKQDLDTREGDVNALKGYVKKMEENVKALKKGVDDCEEVKPYVWNLKGILWAMEDFVVQQEKHEVVKE